MTHDELTEQVARAIHAAEIAYGHDDLEPFDELDPSTRGLAMAYAETIIAVVRAAEQRRIREALRNDASVADRHGYGDKPMTNPEHDPRVEAVAKAIYDLDPDYERDYDDSINILEWDIVGYTMDADNYREQAAAAIAALDIEQIERAAYERGRADLHPDATWVAE